MTEKIKDQILFTTWTVEKRCIESGKRGSADGDKIKPTNESN